MPCALRLMPSTFSAGKAIELCSALETKHFIIVGDDLRKGRQMEEKYLRLLEATKALVNHIDTEHVFDKGVQTGRGAFDTSRSEQLDDLVEKAREAVKNAEDGKK